MGGENPFAEAFTENSDVEHNDIERSSHNPYQLGYVYGEQQQSFRIPDEDFTDSPLMGDGTESTRKGPPPKVPEKLFACSFWDLLICYSELRLYWKIDSLVNSKHDAKVVKQGFWLHWLSITAACLNCATMTSLFVGGGPESGIGKDSIPTFWGFVLSYAYVLLVTFGQYYGWVSPVFRNIKSGYDARWMWFNVFLVLSLGFSVFLFLGLPSTGSVGLFAVLQIRNWTPAFTVTLILSSIFTALQGLSTLWHFYYLSTPSRVSGTEI